MKTHILFLAAALLCAVVCPAFAQSPEPKDRTCYLYAYCKTGAGQICFAVSTDGRHFFALNGGKAVLDTKKISSRGSIGAPYIMRAEDGSFFMLADDYSPAKTAPDSMILLKSADLVNWKSSEIHLPLNRGPFSPRAVYDPAAKKYLIYFRSDSPENDDANRYAVRGAYANADFTKFESEPRFMIGPQSESISDAVIVPYGGKFHMFYKQGGRDKAPEKLVSDTLFPGKWESTDCGIVPKPENGLFSIFPFAHSGGRYGLMTWKRIKGEYEYQTVFSETTDMKTFRNVEDFSFDFSTMEGGSVVLISRSELKALLAKWGKPAEFKFPVQNNPVIEAFYADPGTMYSEKTGKYYIYPTHDGFPGWGGKDFQVFSSKDLKEWTFEKTILTLGKNVKWSSGNAWAPCIMERKQPDGSYKYYFYFCGALKDNGRKCVGCAVADDPAGPFVDTGKPLIDFRPDGVRGGQEIDPDVFHDPVSGKYYLYWGNGYMAGAELADDMTSIKRETVKVFKPGRTFREGTNVIYRNGVYYFTWSVDDTGSPNYHIRYATAKSPLGDLTVPENNVVIEKDPARGILGTGHHQILRIHGTDEWRIVYHRFAWQNGKIMDGPGFHREVCIDKLEFNADGTIKKVNPTL